MASLNVPADLLERLRASPRTRHGDPGPLTGDECEYLALRLEWLAAEVRENPVWEVTWSQDRDVDPDPFWPDRAPPAVIGGPWCYTVSVSMDR